MGNTAVRRQLILKYLLDCQHTTAGELNCAFQMCSRTIRRRIRPSGTAPDGGDDRREER